MSAPAFCVAVIAWLAVAICAHLGTRALVLRMRRSPVRPRDQLAYPLRLAWHKVTLGRRWPRYEGGNEGGWLTFTEHREFSRLAASWRQRGIYADEPDQGKKGEVR